MTTIAYDGKTIAYDSLLTHGSFAEPVGIKKIFPIANDLCDYCFSGGAGSSVEVQAFVEWMEKGANAEEFPEILSNSENKSNLVAIRKESKSLCVFERLPTPLFETKTMYAIGSGYEFAMGAMYQGATAYEAVETASVFNIYTGGDIRFHKLLKE